MTKLNITVVDKYYQKSKTYSKKIALPMDAQKPYILGYSFFTQHFPLRSGDQEVRYNALSRSHILIWFDSKENCLYINDNNSTNGILNFQFAKVQGVKVLPDQPGEIIIYRDLQHPFDDNIRLIFSFNAPPKPKSSKAAYVVDISCVGNIVYGSFRKEMSEGDTFVVGRDTNNDLRVRFNRGYEQFNYFIESHHFEVFVKGGQIFLHNIGQLKQGGNPWLARPYDLPSNTFLDLGDTQFCHPQTWNPPSIWIGFNIHIEKA